MDCLGKAINIEIREVDLNDDEKKEVIVFAMNPYLYGIAGKGVILFVKSGNGPFEANLDFPAFEMEILSKKSNGFKDLRFLVSGGKTPVWCWNGKKYDFDHTEYASWSKPLITDSALNSEGTSTKGDDMAVVTFRTTAGSFVKHDPEAVLALAEDLEKAAKGKPQKTVSLLLKEFDVFYEKSMLEYWNNVASGTYKQRAGDMEKVGWQVLESEGLPYISHSGTWYQKRFASFLPADWKIFMDQEGREIREGFAEDGGVIIPWEEVRKRLSFWENFQKEHPDFPMNDLVQGNITAYAGAFFGLFDNSPINASSKAFQDNQEINPEVKAAYERFLDLNKSSQFYSTLKAFYRKLEKNAFIVTDELKKFPTKNGVNLH
ncbi:MAG: hypothetical protein WA705_09950 [Candidatus Ozemobacteraceae bacterium]